MLLTQIYTPVTHSNGERLVQVTSSTGDFLGWADGRGKFDLTGEWTIDDKWTLEQAGDLGRTIVTLESAGTVVTVAKDGVNRILTVQI